MLCAVSHGHVYQSVSCTSSTFGLQRLECGGLFSSARLLGPSVNVPHLGSGKLAPVPGHALVATGVPQRNQTAPGPTHTNGRLTMLIENPAPQSLLPLHFAP